MTEKELLYVEDALGHATEIKDSCAQLAAQLNDQDLCLFVQGLSKDHGETFSKFYALLN